MAYNKFCWADLSTFDVAQARSDYSKIFDWSFVSDSSYEFAQIQGEKSAAIFPMPEKLAELNLPSFWMSYFHVKNLEEILERALKHEGVIVEIEPQEFDENSRIALLRDPSGAGFTLYEGPDITPQKVDGQGSVITRYHHVPDIILVKAFYEDVFSWKLEQRNGRDWPVFDVVHEDGEIIGQIECVPEHVRGKFKYWIPCFIVNSIQSTKSLVEELGGALMSDLADGRLILADRQGASFMVKNAPVNVKSLDKDSVRHLSNASGMRWRVLLGIVLMWLAVALDLTAFWGVLFLLWTWPAIKTGHAHFIDPVSREKSPITFWLLVGTWTVLSFWMIYDGLPQLLNVVGLLLG